MKKILTYLLFAQLIFLSCKKSEVEPIFEESANKRVTTLLDSYKKQLVGSEFGWRGVYYPNGGNDGGNDSDMSNHASALTTLFTAIVMTAVATLGGVLQFVVVRAVYVKF